MPDGRVAVRCSSGEAWAPVQLAEVELRQAERSGQKTPARMSSSRSSSMPATYAGNAASLSPGELSFKPPSTPSFQPSAAVRSTAMKSAPFEASAAPSSADLLKAKQSSRPPPRTFISAPDVSLPPARIQAAQSSRPPPRTFIGVPAKIKTLSATSTPQMSNASATLNSSSVASLPLDLAGAKSSVADWASQVTPSDVEDAAGTSASRQSVVDELKAEIASLRQLVEKLTANAS
jgi:hypothetical protein